MIDRFRRLGRARFLILFALLLASALYLALGLVSSLSWDGPGWAPADGQPIGRDFVAFWTAAKLALGGDPVAAYDLARIDAAQTAVAQHAVNPVPWHYPPTFLLLVLPLGLLPYPLALALWLVLPMAALALLFRRFAGTPLAAPLALIFPATAQCLISGQNGVLFAALLVAATMLLDRRPLLAGVLLGLFSCKPQLAPLLLPALLFGGCWRALAAAGATAAALAGASLLAFGPEAWSAFLGQLAEAGALLDSGDKPWVRMPTVFAAARLAGLPSGAADLLQGLAALAAAAAVGWAWRRSVDYRQRAAALAAALPFGTSFLFDYDLVLWLVSMAWLADRGLRQGWLRGERAVLLLVWIGPVAGWLIAWQTGLPVMPLVAMVLLAAVMHRIAVAAADPATPRVACGTA
jgi:hypothetical protein